MRSIKLIRLVATNFKSFRAETTVDFTTRGGLKFVGGENRVAPRLGANGAGKSTLWDAVIWCLYGVSARGLRAAELASWGKGEPPRALVSLEIDEAAHVLERTGSPNRILLDGRPAEQGDIDALLGLTRDRFLHSVIFGQAAPLFLDLSVTQRGALLDEILDLGAWLSRSEYASIEAVAAKTVITEHRRKLSYLQGRLDALTAEETGIVAAAAEWEARRQVKVQEIIAQVEAAETKCAKLERDYRAACQRLAALGDSTSIDSDLRAMQVELNQREIALARLNDAKTRLTSDEAFLRKHADCPTCKQRLPAEFRVSELKSLDSQQRENATLLAQAQRAFSELRTQFVDLRDQQERRIRSRGVAERESYAAQGAFQAQQAIVEQLAKMAEHIMADEADPHAQQLADLQAERGTLQTRIAQHTAAQQAAEARLIQLEFWKVGFKRVRLFAVKRVLARLEIEVANAANALGIGAWRIELATETENKSGGMKPGIQIRVSTNNDSGPWELRSGGEAQRIRLAVAIGMASLIQRLAGVCYSWEVWDEPSAWLSPEGIEDLLECLHQRAALTGKSIWLLDHRALIYSGFAEVWNVVKTELGSQVKLIGQEE